MVKNRIAVMLWDVGYSFTRAGDTVAIVDSLRKSWPFNLTEIYFSLMFFRWVPSPCKYGTWTCPRDSCGGGRTGLEEALLFCLNFLSPQMTCVTLKTITLFVCFTFMHIDNVSDCSHPSYFSFSSGHLPRSFMSFSLLFL